MIIIRNKTKDPFARIPLLLLNDNALKWKEKGLLCYLLSKPIGWKLQINDLVNRSQDGKDSIYASLNALIKAGYCMRSESRDDSGKIYGTEYAIADSPCFGDPSDCQFNPYEEEPHTENPNTENPNYSKKEDSKKEDTLLLSELKTKTPSKDAFPWPQIMAIFKNKRPSKKYRTNPKGITDRNLKSFWRRNGKSVAVFELLCDKILESSYLMGVGAYEGKFPCPDPTWSWVFKKSTSGEWRCDKIINGDYSDEKMSFIIEADTTVKAVVIGKGSLEINTSEKLSSGALRYEKVGTDEYTGIDKYIDKK